MMQTYNKVHAEQFADEIYTIFQNFKGSPLTAETLCYLQRELDNLLLEWKLRMGFLPEVEGDCGTGTLKRLVIKQDGSDSIYVYYEIEEDEKFVRKRDAIAQELMAMPGGEHLGEWR